jgi:O-antigen ligase
MRVSAPFVLCASVLAACIVLGGGTRPGFLSDVVVQLAAIPLLAVSVWRIAALDDLPREVRPALYFCVALSLVPVVQLVPLPPAVWSLLPNRAVASEAFDLIGREPSWMPLSAVPRATWLSLLSLLPAVALFLATALSSYRERRLLSLLVLGLGLVSVFLGLTQVAQGPSSPLRFFEITNPTEAVGFFANRNHFAALLYVLMLLAAAWAINATPALALGSGTSKDQAGPILGLVAAFTAIVILLAAQAMTRSRAGLGLAVAGLFGAFALAVTNRRSGSGVTPVKMLLGASVVAVVFGVQFALYRVLERFTSDPLEDARLTFARGTLEAASAYMPIGAGMGSFVPVYARFEAADALLPAFANRAHNDFLELWLEAGVAGIVLMALFAAWFAVRCAAVWRRRSPWGRDIDRSLARAATVIIALLCAHSLVDYPLRTAALMGMFAFACGLLIPPPKGGEEENAGEARARASTIRPFARPQSPAAPSFVDSGPAFDPLQASGPAEPPPRRRGERWGDDVEWPEEWRNPSDQRTSHTPRR